MRSSRRRAAVALGMLLIGLAMQAVLEASFHTPRPLLHVPLRSLPMRLGRWIGHDEPMSPEILERTQADDHLNRVYEDPIHPGKLFKVWLNYSRHGLNLRHSPEVCLPSGGWTKNESQTRVVPVAGTDGVEYPVTRLVYSQAGVVQGLGFWYYIFGEGPIERFARTLPVSSRSSHGRTTRGSGLTVEVFFEGESDPEEAAFREFAEHLLGALEPLLPENRAHYYIP